MSESLASAAHAHLVDINAHLSQVQLGKLNLTHELLMSLGDVVEGEDTEAEAEEEDGAEGNEGPPGELRCLYQH